MKTSKRMNRCKMIRVLPFLFSTIIGLLQKHDTCAFVSTSLHGKLYPASTSWSQLHKSAPSSLTSLNGNVEEHINDDETLAYAEYEGDPEDTAYIETDGMNEVDESSSELDEVNGIGDQYLLADEEEDEDAIRDSMFMEEAIAASQKVGGERSKSSPYPRPLCGAVLVGKDDRIIGTGFSNYNEDAVEACIRNAGILATPLREWCVSWPANKRFREELAESTLYVTLEPSAERKGTAKPPMTQLIEYSGIPRVVIGAPNPIAQLASEGAATLHSAGISVTMGVEQEKCESIISSYAELANGKLHKIARRHLTATDRPLGFLHCSVIDSMDAEAFARNGNAFGKDFGSGTILSMRDFGTYGIAPPPESIWAVKDDEDADWETEAEINAFFEEEDDEDSQLESNPIMPWYEQVDAVVSTFPKAGNGPLDDDSVMSRLQGLKWLATQGRSLPSSVERILVMDATDLSSLPFTNDDPNLPPGVNVESFWEGLGRKPTRVLLRHSSNAMAAAAASAAAAAAQAAAKAADVAREAIDSCDAETAAEAAIEYKKAALAEAEFIQKEVQNMQDLKDRLSSLGVIVETIKGGEPIDVMNHLGQRSGYQAVIWRAGCWGERGVQSILNGAFQWVSAHLAVDAGGGKFWQLMLAERCVQGACGPDEKIKIIAEDEDISLEYCDDESADSDCVLTVDGKQIRHVRLDCRVALIDDTKRHELVKGTHEPIKSKFTEEDAPWFL